MSLMRSQSVFGLVAAVGLLSGSPAIGLDISDYSPAMQCFVDVKKCNYLIGKRVWVRPIKLEKVAICPTDYWQRKSYDPDPCKNVRSGTFTITGIQPRQYSNSFVVKLDDGKSALVGTDSILSLSLSDPVAVAKSLKEECKRRGQPKIGMTYDEAVASCWSKPLKIVKTTTASGVQEDYIYGRGHVLRFTDGKITAILETAGR